jgi:hypothetical protein
MSSTNPTEEELFSRWKSLKQSVQNLSGAVQNPLDEYPFDKRMIDEWLRQCRDFEGQYTSLKKATYAVLKASMPKDGLAGQPEDDSGHSPV